MHCPEPGLEMCQGAVQAENLNKNGKKYSPDMSYLNRLIPSAREGPEYKEYNPEEMNKDCYICSN